MNHIKFIINIFLLIIIITGVGLLLLKPTSVLPVSTIFSGMPETENDAILEMIRLGQESKVYDFYDKFIGNRPLTYLIITTALAKGIPVNYFVALGYTESRFNVNAVGVNKDASDNILSYDYGVFQLNSNTFKDYGKDYLMRLENNVSLAADYLKNKYIQYGNWYEALLSYNAGNTEIIKNKTVRHFVSVLTVQKDLNLKLSGGF